MKRSYILVAIVMALAFASCKKENRPYVDPDNKLLGYWTDPVLNDTIWTYERAAGLPDDDYGFSFELNGTFMERNNSSFCGTPPIVYANYEGTWTETGDILNIVSGFWGGTAHYTWRVISVSDDELIIYKEEETYGGN